MADSAYQNNIRKYTDQGCPAVSLQSRPTEKCGRTEVSPHGHSTRVHAQHQPYSCWPMWRGVNENEYLHNIRDGFYRFRKYLRQKYMYTYSLSFIPLHTCPSSPDHTYVVQSSRYFPLRLCPCYFSFYLTNVEDS